MGLYLHLFLAVVRDAGECCCSIVCEIDELVLTFIFLEFTFRSIKLVANDIQAFGYKGFSLACDLVFVLVGIYIVAHKEFIQVVNHTIFISIDK